MCRVEILFVPHSLSLYLHTSPLDGPSLFSLLLDVASCICGFQDQAQSREGTMDLSMPKYIGDAAERFGIDTTRKIDNPLGTGTTGEAPAAEKTATYHRCPLDYPRAIDSTSLTRNSKLSQQKERC
jgi:hypothetical protein